MHFAFVLFRYFPFGGLQRDAVTFALEAIARGHQVTFFTREWEGPWPVDVEVILLPVDHLTNEGRDRAFVKKFQKVDLSRFDLIVGFNKMPGLDCYYAADPCYAAKINGKKPFWYYFTPRHLHFSQYERAVFKNNTEILLISPQEKAKFQKCYGTADAHFHELPPGVSLERKRPANADEIRINKRQELQIKENEHCVLMVGSGFRTKGVDRSIIAIASLSEAIKNKTQLIIVGSDNKSPFERLAKALGIRNRVHFLGARNDVRDIMLCADVLCHPAYAENTGTVLVEALVTGLPVIATDVCGYAFHIERAAAGKLIKSPYDQYEMNMILREVLENMPPQWSKNALEYAANVDLYSLPQKAVDCFEECVKNIKTDRQSYVDR